MVYCGSSSLSSASSSPLESSLLPHSSSDNSSSSSELFKILADIQERNSDYKIDFKQESDGYHLDFVSKVEEELTW